MERLTPLQQPVITGLQPRRQVQDTPPKTNFSQMLHSAIKQPGVSFSKHAQLRVEQRGISLSEEEVGRLASAVDTALEKGMRQSLILLDNKAFVVNVPGRTVVTLMGPEGSDTTVITNIDGAVLCR